MIKFAERVALTCKQDEPEVELTLGLWCHIISENEFFHELKCNRMTNFMEFVTHITLQKTSNR